MFQQRIGKLAVEDVDAPTLLSCLRRIEKRGAIISSHRARGVAGQVFRYAIATGRATRDPSQDLRGALAPANSSNFAAITEPKQVGELLRAIDGFEGFFPIQCALKFAPLVFARPGELRNAVWEDIDLEKAEWRYFVTKVKVKHIVPSSRQAVTILEERAIIPICFQASAHGSDPCPKTPLTLLCAASVSARTR